MNAQAPGDYVVCKNGHLIGKIDENLKWNDSQFDILNRLRSCKCSVCNELAEFDFPHHGGIDDCLTFTLYWDDIKKIWIIPEDDIKQKELNKFRIRKDKIK